MFKKLLYLFIGLVFTATVANAQITNYVFSASTGGAGGFTAITGGTVLNTQYGGGADSDDGYVNAAPIGFTFNYNGTNYTTYNVCVNGFVTFGGALGDVNNWTNNLTTGGAVTSRPMIAPYWDDLYAYGGVSYVLTGIAPFRVLTVQWLNCSQYTTGNAASAAISFQLKLYETSNIIQFHYRQEAAAPSSPGSSIGITATATGSGNFLSLSAASTAPTVSSTTETSTIATRPATGQIYRFDPRYCAGGANDVSGGGEKISNVSFGSINNSSTSNAQYENFTNVSTNLTPGSTTPMTVTLFQPWAPGDQIIVNIDFNQNGVLSDAGEQVALTAIGGGPFTFNITVPPTATLGYTRMRVRLNDASSTPSVTAPCGFSAWGQVEDYTVNIQNCTASAESIAAPSATSCIGGTASFALVASGTGITYQWQVSTDNGSTWANIANGATYSGVTTATLGVANITAGMNGYRYRCNLGGTCTPANTVYSTPATLTVNTPANVTAQPVATATCTGKNASFSITATGTAPTYQWQVSTDNGSTWANIANGANYAGVTTNTLAITNAPFTWNTFRYRCNVTVNGCGTVNSNGAILTVWALPTLTVSAPLTRLFPGLTTTVSASALPASASNVFTWYRNGAVVNGSTGSSIVVDVDGMGTYNATVKDANGCVSALSNSIVIADSVSSRLFIYPNPAPNGQFQVRYYSVAGNALGRAVVVTDSKGARVWQGVFAVGKPYDAMIINIKNHGRGIYNVELLTGGRNAKRIITGRVVVM